MAPRPMATRVVTAQARLRPDEDRAVGPHRTESASSQPLPTDTDLASRARDPTVTRGLELLHILIRIVANTQVSRAF